jgi:hypothetical protein
MAKTKAKTGQKAKDPAAEGNRYARAARVLAQDDTIDAAILADRAFMSETTAARCLEAWHACVAALIEVGRLPDPAKGAPQKKPTPSKAKPAIQSAPAATETTAAK